MVALAVMVVLAAGAVTVIHLSGTDTRSYTDDMQAQQALTIGNAGLQRALSKLNNGEDPTASDVDFAQGKFSIATDPTQSRVIVTSQVGDATKTQSINANFGRNCVDLIVSSSYISGTTLLDTKLTKTCNNQAILDKMTVSWNWSECACNVNCDGSVDVDDEAASNEIVYEEVGDPGRNKFWICHVPPGNPENAQSIAVPLSSWIRAHSSGTGEHSSDYLGPCIVSQPDDTGEEEPVITCEGTSSSGSSLGSCAEADGDASINKVVCESTTVFQTGSVPSSGTQAVSSGNPIDLADYILIADDSYLIQSTFDKTIPSGAWFTVTVEFADGSTLTGIVKAGDQPAPEEAADDEEEDTVAAAAEAIEVTSSGVTVDAGFNVQLAVLGSAITCGAGGAEVNVRTKLCVDNSCSNLWSYADVDGGETYSTTAGGSGSTYKIEANAYLSSCNNFSRTYDSTNTTQVRTLRNGEQAPSLAGYGGQQSVQQFLSNYLDSSGKAVLAANQVIMLFELGTSGASNSSAADFQDLVILMTVTE